MKQLIKILCINRMLKWDYNSEELQAIVKFAVLIGLLVAVSAIGTITTYR